jgi:hypothetical protein
MKSITCFLEQSFGQRVGSYLGQKGRRVGSYLGRKGQQVPAYIKSVPTELAKTAVKTGEKSALRKIIPTSKFTTAATTLEKVHGRGLPFMIKNTGSTVGKLTTRALPGAGIVTDLIFPKELEAGTHSGNAQLTDRAKQQFKKARRV